MAETVNKADQGTVDETQTGADKTQSDQATNSDQGKATPEPETMTRVEIEAALKRNYDAARRAENKADLSKKEAEALRKDLRVTRDRLEEALEANMSPDEKRARKAERTLEEVRARPQPQYNDDDVKEFTSYTVDAVTDAGLTMEDPRLKEAWAANRDKFPNTPAGWREALSASVTHVLKAERDEAKTKASEATKRTTEKDQAAAVAAKRAKTGPIDRGTPSGGATKPVDQMTPEEFAAFRAEQAKNAKYNPRRG